jgi:adenosylmethionine-8-amino-7-oxononanoate aminotransferase
VAPCQPMLVPPLCADEEHIATAVETLRDAIDAVF